MKVVNTLPRDATDATVPEGRPRRADAVRNRERLVAAAQTAFAAADDTVPLETIARDAGLGVGTLYRHFPTREALVEAVYAAELDEVTSSAPRLVDALRPDVALRAWMDEYARFAAHKRGIIDTLKAGWSSGRMATPTTRERVTAAIAVILDAGASAGSLRADAHADDVTAMLLGIFLSIGPNGTDAQVGRLLDLLVDSLRAPLASP